MTREEELKKSISYYSKEYYNTLSDKRKRDLVKHIRKLKVELLELRRLKK